MLLGGAKGFNARGRPSIGPIVHLFPMPSKPIDHQFQDRASGEGQELLL
jgi:hypothetical protein